MGHDEESLTLLAQVEQLDVDQATVKGEASLDLQPDARRREPDRMGSAS